MVYDITKFLFILLLWLRLVSASPIPGDGPIEARQMICGKGQIFGCLPSGSPGWNSFDLAIPAAGDPIIHDTESPGREVRGSIWSRADGGAFLTVHLVDGYEVRLPNIAIEIQAWVANSQVTLSTSRLYYDTQAGLATIQPGIVASARLNSINPTVKIKWRFVS